MIENKIKKAVRDVVDFPKPGIVFKDITPILKDQELCSAIVNEFATKLKNLDFDVIAGIESRGFLFGLMLANKLNKPFIPIRKAGKLPFNTIKQHYELEYGSATIEMHEDAISRGSKVLIHDDLLATGGTVDAASQLLIKSGAEIAGYSFVITLAFLNGHKKFSKYSDKIITLATY